MEEILVTGVGRGIGGVGNKVVEALLKAKAPVRALTHAKNEHAECLEEMGAKVVIGDLTNLEDVRRAIQGCKRIYFGMGVSPQGDGQTGHQRARMGW